MLNGLDLFSGIGGISLALSPWVRTAAYCEVDRYCQGVLLSKMRSGQLSCAPIWDDVRTLRQVLLPKIDIVYGGFPCQDISVAGDGKGLDGERSGLFFEVVRIVEETQPSFVFLENVAAIRTRGLSRVVRELARLGFDLRWTTISAADVGAPHLRKRWFLLAAHPDRLGIRKLRRWSSGALRKGAAQFIKHGAAKPVADPSGVRWESRGSEPAGQQGEHYAPSCCCSTVANTCGTGREEFDSPDLAARSGHGPGRTAAIWGESWWATEPDVGRVAHGIPHRVDRIRGLGNAVVPLQAREAFKKLIGIERRNK